MPGARIARTRRGSFRLRLPEEERRILRSLTEQLRDLLDQGGEGMDRLFPSPHPDDAELEARYRELIGDDLLNRRLAALASMEASLDAAEVDEEQLTAWLTTMNDIRLVLGTQLDVDEDLDLEAIPEDHPDIERYAAYGYLSWLVAQAVDALSEGLPEPEEQGEQGKGQR